MQTNDREDESQTQNQDNDGVHAQTGALVGVQLQHGTGGTAGAGRASRAGADIAQGLLVVGSGATTQSSARTTGGSRRRRTVDGGGRSGGGTSAGRLGVRAGFSTGGQGRSSTGRGLRDTVSMKSPG